MAKFIVTRTVTQDIIIEGVKDEQEAANRVHGLLTNLVAHAPYDSMKLVDETLVAIDVTSFATIKQFEEGLKKLEVLAPGEDRFTQLTEHEVK